MDKYLAKIILVALWTTIPVARAVRPRLHRGQGVPRGQHRRDFPVEGRPPVACGFAARRPAEGPIVWSCPVPGHLHRTPPRAAGRRLSSPIDERADHGGTPTLAALALSLILAPGCGETPPTNSPAVIVGDCLSAGAGDSARDRETGAQSCCPGLARVDGFEESLLPAGKCIASKGGRSICVACGDASCGVGENFCNCPTDCPAP